MSFTSWEFAPFVLTVLLFYYFPPFRRFQRAILVAASLVFYGVGQARLLPLLAVAVFGTYLFLILTMRDRRWLPIGVAFNLALLAFFKYKLLFLDPATPLLSQIGAIDVLLKLPLPIGISFFVFHNISLLVDLSKRNEHPPSITEVFLYIIFFPQLVSGPITRAENFLPQIKPKFADAIPFADAARWIIIGYFFKLVVANNLNQITTLMDFPLYETVRTEDRWILVILYSYQIYADFFGYSAIAIGLGLLFGYRLPVNFNLPYLSASFAEFWTRWHISLSTWLRTYLYIPLGGNRLGSRRTYLNLMIVMGLGGLWHGAALGYLLWGLLHGLFLVLERPFLPKSSDAARLKLWTGAARALRILLVFSFVSLAWVFFKLPNLAHAMDFLSGMVVQHQIGAPAHIYRSLAVIYALPVIVQHLMPRDWMATSGRRLEPYLYGAMAALAFVDAGPDTSFIYFQF